MFGLFLLWGVTNNAAVNICVKKSLRGHMLTFLLGSSWGVVSYGNSVLHILRNCQTVFQKGSPILHFTSSIWGFQFLWFFFFFFFLRATPEAYGSQIGLGVKLELQLLTFTTATTIPDPSRICKLHHSSWQRQILNPLSEARDRTQSLGY